ncbi:MAG: hypothetical protein ABSH08_18185, partial [Tepidisphaeraceae bacterium]
FWKLREDFNETFHLPPRTDPTLIQEEHRVMWDVATGPEAFRRFRECLGTEIRNVADDQGTSYPVVSRVPIGDPIRNADYPIAILNEDPFNQLGTEPPQSPNPEGLGFELVSVVNQLAAVQTLEQRTQGQRRKTMHIKTAR